MKPAREHVHLVAHRGWSRFFPENTLAALAAGIAAGADEIEFDVRLSADGVPVLCHDERVDRVSRLEGTCGSLPVAELREADMLMPDGTPLPGLGFSSLEEVLDCFGQRVGMNIHIKEGEGAGPILELIAGHPAFVAHGEWIYVAGDATVLDIARREQPRITRCCLAQSGDPDRLIENALEFDCDRLQFRRGRYSREDVERALGHGLVPNLFYADEPREAEEAVGVGIRAVLTNDIGTIREHLRGSALGTSL